jgi:hypothetical protein
VHGRRPRKSTLAGMLDTLGEAQLGGMLTVRAFRSAERWFVPDLCQPAIAVLVSSIHPDSECGSVSVLSATTVLEPA